MIQDGYKINIADSTIMVTSAMPEYVVMVMSLRCDRDFASDVFMA